MGNLRQIYLCKAAVGFLAAGEQTNGHGYDAKQRAYFFKHVKPPEIVLLYNMLIRGNCSNEIWKARYKMKLKILVKIYC